MEWNIVKVLTLRVLGKEEGSGAPIVTRNGR